MKHINVCTAYADFPRGEGRNGVTKDKPERIKARPAEERNQCGEAAVTHTFRFDAVESQQTWDPDIFERNEARVVHNKDILDLISQ